MQITGHGKFIYSVLAVTFGLAVCLIWVATSGYAQDERQRVRQIVAMGTAHGKAVYSLAVTPDGRLLASASADKTIKLWSLADGSVLKTLEGHTDTVTSVATSPDGRFLVSGSADKTVRVWSLPDGALLKTLAPFSKKVNQVAVAAGGKAFGAGSQDGTAAFWSLPDCTLIRTHEESGPIFALAFSPGGDVAAIAPGQTQFRGLKRGFPIELVSLADGSVKTLVRVGNRTVGMHLQNVVSLVFAKDGRLYSADNGRLINVWSAEGQPSVWFAPPWTPGPEIEQLWTLTLSPDGSKLASIVNDGVRLQGASAAPSGESELASVGPVWRGAPLCLVFLPDGRGLLSGQSDGRILGWSVPELRLTGALADRRN